jgi:hypothetical protein
MVLKETLPAMLKASQTNSEQRHALLAQQLQADGYVATALT